MAAAGPSSSLTVTSLPPPLCFNVRAALQVLVRIPAVAGRSTGQAAQLIEGDDAVEYAEVRAGPWCAMRTRLLRRCPPLQRPPPPPAQRAGARPSLQTKHLLLPLSSRSPTSCTPATPSPTTATLPTATCGACERPLPAWRRETPAACCPASRRWARVRCQPPPSVPAAALLTCVCVLRRSLPLQVRRHSCPQEQLWQPGRRGVGQRPDRQQGRLDRCACRRGGCTPAG